MPDAYLFDVRESQIKKYEKLVAMPEVYTNQLYKIGDTVYTVGYYGSVYMFNIKNGEYELIKFDDAKQ